MTKEEIFDALMALPDEDRQWVLNQVMRQSWEKMQTAFEQFRKVFHGGA